MDWQLAPELHRRVKKLVKALQFSHIDSRKIVAFRSYGSKSRARARIWSLPRIWQKALKVEPHYCLEVLSEKFDNLSNKKCQSQGQRNHSFRRQEPRFGSNPNSFGNKITSR